MWRKYLPDIPVLLIGIGTLFLAALIFKPSFETLQLLGLVVTAIAVNVTCYREDRELKRR
jgi:hypothetical protein